MIEYQPNQKYKKDRYTIFLGGSIEMGNCDNWQQKIILDLQNENVILLNPRRDNFDHTQLQSIDNKYFRDQVNWELDGLSNADLIVINLLPGTYSPISLLEIGLFTKIDSNNDKMLICCPEGFWRKGNIEIISNRFGINLFQDYNSLLKGIKEKINLFCATS